MFFSLRALSVCTFLSCALSLNTLAIEPDGPRHLITAEQAAVIVARQYIDLMKPPSDKADMIDRIGLANYYASHDSSLLWVDQNGLTDKASRLAQEIRQSYLWGLNVKQFDLPQMLQNSATPALAKAEVKMSLAILKYARQARGGRMKPKDLSIAIDRIPPLEDPRVVLEMIRTTEEPAAYLRSLHPQHDQFKKLRLAYLDALGYRRQGTLYPDADIRNEHTSKHKARQSSRELVQRLLYNMEMWRWMPRDLGANYVLSNIPEFKVRVIRNGRVILEERVIVGKTTNMTPVFSDEMEKIVFQPFWFLPNSIKVKEILPGLVRKDNILRRQNLKISYAGREIRAKSVDWSKEDIRKYYVFQPPGPSNALGNVKFLFPNEHAVYMHDTPSRKLFRRKRRAYSHGCVRVRNPLQLAALVLEHDKSWQRSKVDALVSSGPPNNEIKLTNKIPVHITYFTARIADSGKLKLFKDIYGHEKLIQMGLDGKTHLIVKKDDDLDAALEAAVRNAKKHGQLIKRRRIARRSQVARYVDREVSNWSQRAFEPR